MPRLTGGDLHDSKYLVLVLELEERALSVPPVDLACGLPVNTLRYDHVLRPGFVAGGPSGSFGQAGAPSFEILDERLVALGVDWIGENTLAGILGRENPESRR
jgi:hypothetical protein